VTTTSIARTNTELVDLSETEERDMSKHPKSASMSLIFFSWTTKIRDGSANLPGWEEMWPVRKRAGSYR
jgi:hypothetical protein